MATRIYMGNLSYSADGQQLWQLVGAFGEVVEATMVMDCDTRQSKGFGFVRMPSDGSALGDRTITVNKARRRAERFPGRDRRW